MIKGTYDLELLEELIASIMEASSNGAAIIVEGIKDRKSLRELGATGDIIMAAQRPAIEVAEDVARKFDEIIVLTDWDREGEELAVKMDRHLCWTRARIDLDTRSRLKKLVRRDIKDVESLSKYMKRMREL